MYIIVVIGFTIVVLFMVFIIIARFRQYQNESHHDQVIQTAKKRLITNPYDKDALTVLSEIFFEDRDWQQTLKFSGMLINSHKVSEGDSSNNLIQDLIQAKLRYGISAFHLNMLSHAGKMLESVKKDGDISFEGNYYLGITLFKRGEYQRALTYLRIAVQFDSEHFDCLKCLGMTYFYLKQYKLGEVVLNAVRNMDPEDCEIRFFLASCYFRARQFVPALQILEKLLENITYGPRAALIAGSVRINQQNLQLAKEDLEIGLSHKIIKQELKLELLYQLGTVLSQLNDMKGSQDIFTLIHNAVPDYRDVDSKLAWLRELSMNTYLNMFITAERSKFIILCKRLCTTCLPNVRIINTVYQFEGHLDIHVDTEIEGRVQRVIIRFIRSIGIIGDIILRDMNSCMAMAKVTHGICVCAGYFSQTAIKFSHDRFIKLVPKSDFLNCINKL